MENKNKKFEGRLVINGPKKMKIKRTYKVLGDSAEEVEQKVRKIVFSTKQQYKTNLVNWDCQLGQV